MIVSVAADDEPGPKTGNNWSVSAPPTGVTRTPPADVDYIVQSVGAPTATAACSRFRRHLHVSQPAWRRRHPDVFWTAYISTNDNLLQVGTDRVADSGTIAGGLAEHDVRAVSFTGTWPSLPATAYLIIVVSAADDTDTVNNLLVDTGHATALPAIDYVVVSTSNASGTVAGDSFSTESFTVRNNSPTDDGLQTIYWTAYISTNNGTLDAADEILDSGSLSPLNKGVTSSAQSFDGTRPAAVGTTYWLIVNVASSYLPPVNAGNNWTASVSRTTTSPAVNYTITLVNSPVTTTAGSAFTTTFTMQNAGTHDGTLGCAWVRVPVIQYRDRRYRTAHRLGLPRVSRPRVTRHGIADHNERLAGLVDARVPDPGGCVCG